MKTLYLECQMGCAGDMLLAALLELHPDAPGFLARLNGLGIPEVEVSARQIVKQGVTGTQVKVRCQGQEEESRDFHLEQHGYTHDHVYSRECVHNHEHGHSHEYDNNRESGHSHRGLPEIEQLLHSLPLAEQVLSDALAVYQLIAGAESQVHGQTVTQVHFHEVGMLDAVADIVGCCLLLGELAPQQVLVSPIEVGSGHVRCAHGILPVPAPATALILRGLPIRGGTVQGELCTPTGAALLRHFGQHFGDLPLMQVERIGYGMGSKDFPVLSCLRAFWGEAEPYEG